MLTSLTSEVFTDPYKYVQINKFCLGPTSPPEQSNENDNNSSQVLSYLLIITMIKGQSLSAGPAYRPSSDTNPACVQAF